MCSPYTDISRPDILKQFLYSYNHFTGKVFLKRLLTLFRRKTCAGFCTAVFSPEESNDLRRLMAKKYRDGVEERRPAFVRHAIENGYAETQANALYDLLSDQASNLCGRRNVEIYMAQWLKDEYERLLQS